MWVCEWFFFSWHSIELTGQFPCCLVFSFSNKRTQLETGLGGFRTGTSRYSKQILASTSWRITLSGTKLGKVEKMFTRQTNQKKKKKLKRERETDIHMNWILCLPGYFIKSFTVWNRRWHGQLVCPLTRWKISSTKKKKINKIQI